ncbi:TPA: MFS transporter [Pseudomonas aeruginosa]|uniref:MFS transporter n=1 Tax=Gammaproteobacteria TaxID=1236 RepID=UPI001A8FB6FB|nr:MULTISPECIES: MFS transporter [Gammaproteobacteria]MBN9702819.1 MFS transporter [Enterobacter roggenkampii]HBN8507754.1 MFS transporter [Pseudomonas aeruginosa]HCI6318481.1 MFS transporter [Klebsiella quasipneumoniae subsp. similipneumoniae]
MPTTTSLIKPVPNSNRGMVVLALTLAVFFAASTAPTPLYGIYQHEWSFSPVMLTLVFAVYSFSLLVALLTMGALSDHVGRKPAILLSLVLVGVSMAIFAQAQGLADLLWARSLQGIATGIATSAVGAAMLDLDRENGTLINTLSPLLGMAAGILGAGEYATRYQLAIQNVFWALLIVFIALACGVAAIRESGHRRPGVLESLKPKVRVAAHIRGAYARMAPMNVAAWALGAFYLSLGPSVIIMATGLPSLGGRAVCLNMLSSAVVIWFIRRWQPHAMERMAGLALILGMLALMSGVYFSSTTLILAASVAGGIGFGAGFIGSLRSVMSLSAPHERGGLLSAIYVMNYISFSLPAIAAGQLAKHIGLASTTYIYSCAIIILSLSALWASKGTKKKNS